LFGDLAKAGVNVDMIIQNISRTRATDISFTVPSAGLERTREAVKKAAKRIGAKGAKYDKNIAKVSIVGIGMRSHSGVAARMFSALASEKINIEMISTSEIKISCVIEKKKADKAVKAIHKAFELGKSRKKS
jgi:aspartate kinase